MQIFPIVDPTKLLLDGSNANQTIDIGSEDLTTTGRGTFDAGVFVSTLRLSAAQITDTGGTIGFNADNLTSIGNITVTSLGTFGSVSTATITDVSTFTGSTTAMTGIESIAGVDGSLTLGPGGAANLTLGTFDIDIAAGVVTLKSTFGNGDILFSIVDGATQRTGLQIDASVSAVVIPRDGATTHSYFAVGGAQDGKFFHDGSNTIIYNTFAGGIKLENNVQDGDIIFQVDDGGVDKTITWNADVDQLVHSNALFNFNSAARIGDGTTNYSAFATDGELTLVGTARVKKNIAKLVEAGRGANSPTERTDEAPYVSWTFAINDDSEHTLIIPHDMDFTQDAIVYVQWYTSVDQTDDEVNWQVEWNSRAVGETINAGSTTDTSGDVSCGTQWVITETLVETITGNSIAADDILGLDLKRIAIVDGTDPAVGSIHVLGVHVEYTANKLGDPT